MKRQFFERTAYQLSQEPAPSCFLRLGEHFERQLVDAEDLLPLELVLAESLCGRMADIEMYAFLIEDARKRRSLSAEDVSRASDVKAAVLTRSFLVGYFGACRSLLDSAALSLALLYEIPLSPAECNFSNGDFWHQFVVKEPNKQRRYHPLRLFFVEVLDWCSELAARMLPIVLHQHHFGQYARREILLQVVDDRRPDLARITADSAGIRWVDPLDLHRRWKPNFLLLCEKLCADIAQWESS